MLVLVDTVANSNKFYRVVLDGTTGRVEKEYGRVGAAGTKLSDMSGRAGYESIIRQKMRKGYQKVQIADEPAVTTNRSANTAITDLAKTGLTKGKARTDTRVADLIERICKVNAHDVATISGGRITVDLSGRVRTPLGLVTMSSISEAERVLDRFTAEQDAHRRRRELERYLTLVPQNVGRTAGWDAKFARADELGRQRDFLKQLRDSVSFFDAQVKAAEAAALDSVNEDDIAALFKYRIRAVADGGDVFKRISEKFESTKNTNHDASRLKVKHVFELIDPVGAKEYKAIADEIRNEQQLWHGTRAANLLSILQKGLFIPPRSGSGIQIAGRMFGDGLYLSSQSSKSAMYSTGYWTAGRRETNCFMLLADVAMGSEYRPASHSDWPKAHSSKNQFGKPWNSINVKAGTAGVRNHEAIVWDTRQVKVRYLVELDA
ncbi:WGR domain-containing protein [Agromyces humi]|uniref:WGR domain-containing protein n=1 Tax=Agromyces humi TaxID=1766800 RepID=UPI0013593AED|nr:WGR domain-containing protein [Agromyces humi]